MNDYTKAVVEFSDSKKDFQFTNKGMLHAAVVVANLIRTTKDELRIYSGEMNSDVANDRYLIKMLNEFLQSGKRLYLILDKMPNKNEMSESLKQILNSKNNPSRNVKIKVDDGSFKKIVANLFTDNLPHHFMVADNSAYRIELDANEYKAICNFNDEDTVRPLKKIFDNFFIQE